MEEKNDAKENIELKNIFSQNLLFFRKKSNLSQKELAEKLKTSNKNISKWERAETIPDILTIKKIAEIFNITIDILINPLANDSKKAITEKIPIPFKWKLSMLLLVDSVVFLLACVLFFIFKANNINSFKTIYLFIYLLPIIDLSIFIFICITSKKVDPISLSVFGWLIAVCFFLAFLNKDHIAYIFVIAGAYQIIAPVFAYLINTRKIIMLNKTLLSKLRKQNTDETNIEEE